MESRKQKAESRKRKAEGGNKYFVRFLLLLTAYCLLPSAFCFSQGRIYDGSAPLYSPRPGLGAPGSGLPTALREVKIEQHLNQQIPLDAEFKDETGRTVHLSDYFNQGKPVVLALVYYQCPMLCNQILNGLTTSLRAQSFNAGKEFEVVAVSFDPRETPALAADKKQSYLVRYNRPGTEDGWHFLTGDDANIHRLTDAVGFYYNFDAQTNQFAHASGIMVLTPEGKLSRYFYGIDYDARDLRLGLVEASNNKIGSLTDQLLLYCYHYDPATGKYAWVVNIYRWAGGATVLCIVGLLFILRRRNRKTREARPVEAALNQGGTA